MDWLDKVPYTIQHPEESKEMVHFSTVLSSTLVTTLTREVEECDPTVVGMYPLVPLLKDGHHHPSVSLQWFQM